MFSSSQSSKTIQQTKPKFSDLNPNQELRENWNQLKQSKYNHIMKSTSTTNKKRHQLENKSNGFVFSPTPIWSFPLFHQPNTPIEPLLLSISTENSQSSITTLVKVKIKIKTHYLFRDLGKNWTKTKMICWSSQKPNWSEDRHKTISKLEWRLAQKANIIEVDVDWHGELHSSTCRERLNHGSTTTSRSA